MSVLAFILILIGVILLMFFLKIAFAVFRMVYSVRKITKTAKKASSARSQYSSQTGAGRIIELDKDQYKID